MVIINQKMSGTGTIHDLASEHYDIKIDLRGDQHAVMLPDWYKHDPYIFDTLKSAITKGEELYQDDYSNVTILDSHGYRHTRDNSAAWIEQVYYKDI